MRGRRVAAHEVRDTDDIFGRRAGGMRRVWQASVPRRVIDLHRRQLLELAGAAGAGAIVGSGLAGCASAMERRDVLPQPPGSTPGIPEILVQVLGDAALAPSSHNSQPWRVVVHDPSRLTVHEDLARTLPDVDPAGRELRLSLGGFIENLAISAEAHGLACAIDLSGGSGLGAPIAEVALGPRPPSGYPLARLRARCTAGSSSPAATRARARS